MSFPKYEKYKDSGVEWLGEVPAHWELCLLKRAFRSVDYGISDSLNSEGTIAILRMGNIANGRVVMDDMKYTDSIDPSLLLVWGDLLYNRTNSLDLIGKVGMFLGSEDRSVSFASYLVRLRMVEDSLPEYFAYLLNTEGILCLARANAFVSIGQCNLNPTRYGQIGVSIPPKIEQAAIVHYLDSETMKIDELVAEQRRLMEVLKEKRQVFISQVVTRGLNPNVKLKPSGIEWIGDVPAHWEVKKLRYLCNIQTGARDTEHAVEDGEFPFFVRSQTIEQINSKSFDCEAVLTAGDGAGVGKVFHYYEGPFDFHQRVYMMNNFKHILGRFFFHYFREHFYRVALDGGAKSTVDSLRRPMLTNFPVCLPPKDEQEKIIRAVEKFVASFDTLTAEAQRAIDLLQERRTALISAAVTGKIDVRQLNKN